MRRLHCQLPADIMRSTIMLLRLSVLTGELANYSQNITIGSSLFTQFMITLLYYRLSTQIPLIFINISKTNYNLTNNHNTRHRTNSNFNTPLFNHSKTQKCYLYQVIPIWNSLPNSLKNCSSKFTFKKQIKRHVLASQY